MTKRSPVDPDQTTTEDSTVEAAVETAARSSDPLDRVLSRASASESATVIRDLTGGALALGDESHDQLGADLDAIRMEREDRASLRRVVGLSTELEDVTEVEYRQLRLENVVLIGIYSQKSTDDAENSLRELAALAETAGAEVLDGLLQRRANPDPATYLGKGKAQELAELVAAVGADTVIADTELAPSQRRALEDVVKVKVIDRTAVILDIFSQHAKSREGKAQVELAQLQYLLPRLRGWGDSMSRQAGGQVGSAGAGMGSRGPGETKMELDRRKIHTRMAKLRKQIKEMGPARAAKRANRKRAEVPSVAIAGYTNAGKSSLLNRLTGTQELVQNQLFATLDTAVRHAETDDGRQFTFTDTVGFVRALPHQLVEAFRSTFEEVGEADVILHVVDGSHPDPEAQLRTVREVIAEVDAQGIPEIVAFNKADLIDESQRMVLHGLVPDAVFVSARTGEGIAELTRRVHSALPIPDREVTVIVPYDRGELVAEMHERNRVMETEYVAEGTRVRAFVTEEMLSKLTDYLQ
ncbi:GTPase HflX [Leucobacter luti]|uniref:GTPase HflX n=1 Tax=Leucobacter luti TaxID=340320 RepID=A0A4R6S497_9MICO|nr:GTPase HflX [Leucobacter luti]MCW2287344.1 GTP-binding protein HflX [Leucobacter luti]QYM76583.1 GTPase HflX [Leucobacter luti]TCK41567.1 GTP-binding protein HflX [Leucobacter luti]TDP94549.1 GTP-binding protein HflX [Leucobacter luti]